jgi:hypothetical protein
VAQLVRVQAGQSSLLAAAPQHLHQAPSGQPALQPKPQPGERGVLVASPGAKVAVQAAGLLAKRQRALAAALAEQQQHVQVQVHMRELEVDQLGPAGARPGAAGTVGRVLTGEPDGRRTPERPELHPPDTESGAGHRQATAGTHGRRCGASGDRS